MSCRLSLGCEAVHPSVLWISTSRSKRSTIDSPRPSTTLSATEVSDTQRGLTMIRPVTVSLLLGLVSAGALAQIPAIPKEHPVLAAASSKHLVVYRTERSARENCPPGDKIVWADTRSRTLYLRGDKHWGHTHGGFACESEGRASGYRGPAAHA